MRGMTLFAVLLAATAAAQKPWEVRVDLPVPVPVELSAVPPTNPFAAPVLAPPSPVATPLRAKFTQTLTVLASAYLDGSGALRRLVFTSLPWPSLEAELRLPLSELEFAPARAAGAPTSVWLPLAVDLAGRIDGGQVTRLVATTPDPKAPPTAEPGGGHAAEPGDLALPATPLARVEQLPNPRHPPRIRVPGRSWRQAVRLLADVGADGRCRRVVFLSCPEGLRPWLLASLADWTFRPAAAAGGPVEAWAVLDGEVEVEMGSLAAEALRVTRTGSYPGAAAAPASPPPPGA